MLYCAIQQPAFQEWLDRSTKQYSKSGRLTSQRKAIGTAFPVTFTKSSAGLSCVTLAASLSFWREFKLYIIDGEKTTLMQYEMKFPERVDNHSRITLKFNNEIDENLWVCAILTAILGLVESNFVCTIYYNATTRVFSREQ